MASSRPSSRDYRQLYQIPPWPGIVIAPTRRRRSFALAYRAASPASPASPRSTRAWFMVGHPAILMAGMSGLGKSTALIE